MNKRILILCIFIIIFEIVNILALNKMNETIKEIQMKTLETNLTTNIIEMKQEEMANVETELLARLIESEAGCETYEGKLAVGAVVVNRTKDEHFKNNISDVIYTKGQFDPITYNKLSTSYSKDSYNAATTAIKGIDNTKGALYFYNPKITKDKWIRTKTITVKIGNHIFAK